MKSICDNHKGGSNSDDSAVTIFMSHKSQESLNYVFCEDFCPRREAGKDYKERLS